MSLKAKAGGVISVIGSSGSGKSTMLRCINFLEQPSVGRMGRIEEEGRPEEVFGNAQSERLKQFLSGSLK